MVRLWVVRHYCVLWVVLVCSSSCSGSGGGGSSLSGRVILGGVRWRRDVRQDRRRPCVCEGPRLVCSVAGTLQLRGGADNDDWIHNDPDVNRWLAFEAESQRWKDGYEQWAALNYYQLQYWGGPCPEEGCRCKDENAQPPIIALPAQVHPSVMHKYECTCPACKDRRVAAARLDEELKEEETAEAVKVEEDRKCAEAAMKEGEEGSVYSLHGAYNTDDVPAAIMVGVFWLFLSLFYLSSTASPPTQLDADLCGRLIDSVCVLCARMVVAGVGRGPTDTIWHIRCASSCC